MSSVSISCSGHSHRVVDFKHGTVPRADVGIGTLFLYVSDKRAILFRPERPPELGQLDQEFGDAIIEVVRAVQAAGDRPRDVETEEIASLVVDSRCSWKDFRNEAK